MSIKNNTTSLQNLLNAVYALPEATNPVQPDWNQSDEMALDFIKNRTHWAEEPVTTVETILEETTVEFDEYGSMLDDGLPIKLIDGAELTITWDGIEYTTIAQAVTFPEVGDCIAAGNPLLFGMDENAEDNGQPFAIGYIPSYEMTMLISNDTEAISHTVKIVSSITTQEFHKLDSRYIPEHSHKWNDVKDRPFVTVPSETLVCPDNTEGCTKFTFEGIGFAKVSDAIPTKQDCANGIEILFRVQVDKIIVGEEALIPFIADQIQGAFADDGFCFFPWENAAMFIVPHDNYDFEGIILPESGIYVGGFHPTYRIAAITIPGYEFQREILDSRYLPNNIGGGSDLEFDSTPTSGSKNPVTSDGIYQALEAKPNADKYFEEKKVTTYVGDTLTWDGETEGLVNFERHWFSGSETAKYYKVSNSVPMPEDYPQDKSTVSYIVISDDNYTTHSYQFNDSVTIPEDGCLDALAWVVVPYDNYVLPGMLDPLPSVIVPEAGIYFVRRKEYHRVYSVTIPGYNFFARGYQEILKTDHLPEALRFGEITVGDSTEFRTIDPKYLPKGIGGGDELVSTHNTDTSAHGDIRNLISGLTTRLNALADSDDTTLDQMSEIVAYIKSNKSLIDSVTTSKVNVSDIINNLTTNVSNKPLSAAQGVALKGLIDTLQSAVNSKAASSDLTSHTGNKSNPHGVTKAQIGLGNVENKSSATIRGELTKANVTTALGYTPPTQDTTYSVATTSTAGLMSAVDKAKLDGLSESGGSTEGAVLYTEQELTDEQKAQARKNIGAVGEDELFTYAPGASSIILNGDMGSYESIDGSDFNLWGAYYKIADTSPETYSQIAAMAEDETYFPLIDITERETNNSYNINDELYVSPTRMMDEYIGFDAFYYDYPIYMIITPNAIYLNGDVFDMWIGGDDMGDPLDGKIISYVSKIIFPGVENITPGKKVVNANIIEGTFSGEVAANSSGQTASAFLLRNSKLVPSDTNPTVNGEICWTYE